MSDTHTYPAYLSLTDGGSLGRRADKAREYMKRCVLCGRRCHTDRLQSTRGVACRTGWTPVVSSYGAHHGEEAPLRGWRGSGTIFFSWCNLRCVFCQNWEISHKGTGREVEIEELAQMMLDLQDQGCHNVNFVSPSHVVAQILAAVTIAVDRGLRLPLVYNSGGYDSPEALELLDGVIDIYMPDMKYGNSMPARQYSHVQNYALKNRGAVKEMHRQVGDLVLDENGIARRGLLVRHLVLPGGVANTGKVLKFLAEEISPNTYLNLMNQYRPYYKALDLPILDRPLSSREYDQALALARKYGLNRLDKPSVCATGRPS